MTGPRGLLPRGVPAWPRRPGFDLVGLLDHESTGAVEPLIKVTTPMQYPSTERFGILFVCSGGRCRSPAAEVLARLLLNERFGPLHAAQFDVSSAGTQAVPGEPIDPRTRTELVELGLASGASLPDSAPLSAEAIEAADLVLTAERTHRSMVVQMAPGALGKTFCLREFARLLASIDCEGMPSEPVARARAMVVAARDNRGVIPPVPPSEDEIADPMGRGQTAHHVAAALISSALAQILGVRPPVVADSKRRWYRPIRRWTASPATGRTSAPEPARGYPPAIPTVNHDPQPRSSDVASSDPASSDAASSDAGPLGDQPGQEVAAWSGASEVAGTLQPTHEPTHEATLTEPLSLATTRPQTVPTVAKAALGLWIASCLAGLIAMALSFSNLTEPRTGLRALANEIQPDAEADVVDDVVNIVLYGSLGSTLFLISIQVILVILMWTGRNWARVPLTVVAVLSLPVLFFTYDVLGTLAAATLALESLLMPAAVVTMFLPPANSWLRRRR